VKVLGISGSLRDASWNTRLLRAAAELVPGGDELTRGAQQLRVPGCVAQAAGDGEDAHLP
jgi:NAD(P)H-dependent FMN reductase